MRIIAARSLLTVLLAALTILVLPPPASADKTGGAVVAILDWQEIFRKSKASLDVAAQVEVYKNAFQDRIRLEEEELRSEEQELKRQRPILAQEAFDQKRRAFERRVTSVQRRVRERNRALDQMKRQSRQTLSREVLAIVSEMSETDGFNLVLDRSQVIFFDKTVEITNKVMARLNKRLPVIKVPPPKGE